MGFMDSIRIRGALVKQQKGQTEDAIREYEALWQKGVISANYILPYTTLLLRRGGEDNYRRCKEMLMKAQKAPDLDANARVKLFINYSAAEYKLGDLDAAIRHMETIAQKKKTGDVYTVLGYLYIEAGDKEKALQLNLEGLEYDDEDPIILDNLGQLYYRLMDDKEKALEYFSKAIELKPGQIDTLYFLSRYDLEKGDRDAAKEKLETALEGNFSPLNYLTRKMCEEELEKLK